jgi:hypothetical protein
MPHKPVTVGSLLRAVSVLGWIASFGMTGALVSARTGPRTEEYCNEDYMYCVRVPHGGKLQPHEGDSPNHGATIDLPQHEGQAWTYAHWGKKGVRYPFQVGGMGNQGGCTVPVGKHGEEPMALWKGYLEHVKKLNLDPLSTV